MSRPRTWEPLRWALFSSGGMIAALLLPAIAFVLWIAAPHGWVDLRPREDLLGLLLHPLGRLVLSALVPLSFFHWAHRFRYTLYDGLQLKHLNALIASICYGGAAAASLAALLVLWTL